MGLCLMILQSLVIGWPWYVPFPAPLVQSPNPFKPNLYGPSTPRRMDLADNQVMPIDEYEKARLLPIRSPRLRLKLIVHWIDSLRSSWW